MDDLCKFILAAFCKYPFISILKDQSRIMCPRLAINDEKIKKVINDMHPELSKETSAHIVRLFHDEWCKRIDGYENIIFVLYRFAHSTLRMKGNAPVVKFDKLFHWRELVMSLDEDMFVCALLAHNDNYMVNRNDFNWDMVLRSDDVDIGYLQQQGLYELHSHFKATGYNSKVSWLYLMNHIVSRKFFKDAEDGLYDAYIEAVAIRIELFRTYILKISPTPLDKAIRLSTWGENSLLRSTVTGLRRSNNIDYAITDNDPMETEKYSVMRGERRLLYLAMRTAMQNGENADITSYYLYKYLLAKNKIRNFFIQTNEKIGLSNFQSFDRRKEYLFWGNRNYLSLRHDIIYYESMRHHIIYLETRITPSENVKSLDIKAKDCCPGKDQKVNTHLIVHFIKSKEEKLPHLRILNYRCYKVRQNIKRQAFTLVHYLKSDSFKFECPIIGIDAAGNELKASPEVFAQVFRYIRYCCPNIGLTYHAGEDFYDLIDGMRSIDEAILYMQMRHGDRIGHALAAGIDAERFYKERQRNIIIPKQVLIDNIVWFYFHASIADISFPSALDLALKEKFHILARELGYCHEDKGISMDDYYHSMLLRGDNPETLGKQSSEFSSSWRYCDQVKDDNILYNCHKNDNVTLDDCRKDNQVIKLVKTYYYDYDVRVNGEKVEEFHITQEYVNVVKKLQDWMIDKMDEMQLCVECCPTSNFKIGKLGQYDYHPIFRFNTVDSRHQLPVTINTDDQGIFSTSLDVEYALVSLAMQKMKDAEGKPCFSRAQVENWITRIYTNSKKFSMVQLDED
jgi:adenosine deaminase